MKAKINIHGQLEIARAGKFKEQNCAITMQLNPNHTKQGIAVPCGDWCPLFGEPEPEKMFEPNSKQDRTVLSLCKTVLFLDEFTDQRNSNDNN